jgi:hypothetical protein
MILSLNYISFVVILRILLYHKAFHVTFVRLKNSYFSCNQIINVVYINQTTRIFLPIIFIHLILNDKSLTIFPLFIYFTIIYAKTLNL